MVVSARDASPSFSTVVQLTSVEPERVEATVPDVPFVNFAFIIPHNADVRNGAPEAGSKPFEKAEFASRIVGQWVVITFSLFDCVVAFGEIRP
jgi:hypothetical protein